MGEGAFGKVYRGFFAEDESKLVAAKAIPIKDISNSDKMLQLIKREISILQKIKNKYIVKLHDVARTNNNLYLFFEYCSDGDLKKYLDKKDGRRLSENEACLFMRHLCEGFKTLYSENIIHRDIKPANILLHEGIAKISDFGFARQIETGMDQPNYLSRLGSPLYMGPQILDNKQFSSKCDVWSVGIVFYEMLYGKTPWSGDNQVKLLGNIKTQPLELPETPKRSDAVKDLLKKMLSYEEEKRLKWSEVFEHPLLTGYNSPTSSQIDINDPALQAQLYAKKNLVIGYLNQDIEKPVTQSEQPTEASFKNRQSFMDTSQATLMVLEQSKTRNKILKINELVIYQRNIGFFFNYVTIQLVKDKKSGVLKIENHLYIRLLYIVSKNQIMEQEKTKNFILSNENPDIKDWKKYKESVECKNTLQIVTNDCAQSMNFFEDITKQIEAEFSTLRKKSSDQALLQKIEKFSKIINNVFNRAQQPNFMEIYKETLNEYLNLIKPEIAQETLDKNQLKFANFIVICLNPYEIFKPESYQSFDFNFFYEDIENKTREDILKDLKEKLKL